MQSTEDALAAAVTVATMLGLGDEAGELLAGHRSRAFQVGTIIAGIVIGAAILIGLFVIASLNGALPLTDIVADPGNSSLVSAKNQTVARVGDAMLLGSVVIIVLFAAVILRVLRGL